MKAITLTNGLACYVDASDFDALVEKTWFAFSGRNTTYAVTSVREVGKAGGTNIRMHRLLAGTLTSDRRVVVDHIDGNGLNNCRANLRITTIAKNLHGVMRGPRGKSRFRGVGWHKSTGKWEARISVDGKRQNLGLFDTEEEAALAYNEAKIRQFGPDYELNEI